MMISKQKTKSLINKATTNDRNPPSGYLLNELALKTASISECQSMEDLLLKKLSKNKPYIKYKALRIIKYLSENGSLHWCRTWQTNKNKLIEAQQFRGQSDPIYGDAPFQQVRKAAKEAIQAVFEQKKPIHIPVRKPTNPWIEHTTNTNTFKKPKSDKQINNIKIKKTNGKYERRWVRDIVQSCGIGCKIQNVSEYVKQFETLNKKYVLKELNKILTDTTWQKQGKALVFIEGLMNGTSSDYVINYFNESYDNIQLLQNSNKSVLRRKANAVIEYLNICQDTETESETEETEQTETSHLFEAVIDVDTQQNDMFYGMNVKNDSNENKTKVVPVDNDLMSFFSDKNIENNINDANNTNNINNTQQSEFGLDLNTRSKWDIPINIPYLPNNIINVRLQPPNVFTQHRNCQPIYNENDPFAEIMNEISTQSTNFVPNHESSTKHAPDPFAQFAQFGAQPMQ